MALLTRLLQTLPDVISMKAATEENTELGVEVTN